MVVSAFAFGGLPKKVLAKAFKDSEIFVSPQLLDEYRDVPRELLTKNKIGREQFKTLIAGDKDLLDIGSLPFRLQILTPRAFIKIE